MLCSFVSEKRKTANLSIFAGKAGTNIVLKQYFYNMRIATPLVKYIKASDLTEALQAALDKKRSQPMIMKRKSCKGYCYIELERIKARKIYQ